MGMMLEKIGEPAMLEQLAEECMELGMEKMILEQTSRQAQKVRNKDVFNT